MAFLYEKMDVLRENGYTAELPAYIPENLNPNFELRPYQKMAFENFAAARSREEYPIAGMDEVTLDYLIAALGFKFNNMDVASKLLSNVLTSKKASQRLKDFARDLKDDIAKRKEKEAAEAAG